MAASPAIADWITIPVGSFPGEPLLGFATAGTLDPADPVGPPPEHVAHIGGVWVEEMDPGGSTNVMEILLDLKKLDWDDPVDPPDIAGSSKDHIIKFDTVFTLFETSPGVYDLTGPGTSLGTFTGLGQKSGIGGGALQVITGFTFTISAFDPGLGTEGKIFWDLAKSDLASDPTYIFAISGDELTITVTGFSMASGESLADFGALGLVFKFLDLEETDSSDWASGATPDEDHHPFLVTITPMFSVVPEPSSFLLLGLAGLALFWRRRLRCWRAGAVEAPRV